MFPLEFLGFYGLHRILGPWLPPVHILGASERGVTKELWVSRCFVEQFKPRACWGARAWRRTAPHWSNFSNIHNTSELRLKMAYKHIHMLNEEVWAKLSRQDSGNVQGPFSGIRSRISRVP